MVTNGPSHLKQTRVVLVTGASTGIGLALVTQLKSLAYHVVATARASSLHRFTKQGLKETESFLIRPLDVTNFNEQEILVKEVNERWGGVDVLVNNAGVSYRSVIEHVSSEEDQEQFAINYFGPMNLIRLVLPSMRQKRNGMIINISSVGGMMAMPTMGIYSGSKFALEGASEALWYEMRPWNIRVCLIEPGFIHSDSFLAVRWSKLGKQAANDPFSTYHAYYLHMGCMIAKLMRNAIATPESIAKKIIQVTEQTNPPLRVPATFDAWGFLWLRRLLPRKAYHQFLYHFLPKIKQWVD